VKPPAILSTDLLTIYLNDHLGGATFGSALARRCAASNEGTEFGAPLRRLSSQIQEDREALISIVARLRRPRDPVKVTGGWLAERIGRFKPNGRLVGYSPLSRLLELEALEGGVEAKLALWRSLRASLPQQAGLDQGDIDRLIDRAQRQRRELARLQTRAAELAFGDGQPHRPGQ
jgi:hypothetical protein